MRYARTRKNAGWDRLEAAFETNDAGYIAGEGFFDVQTRAFLMIPNA